MYIRCVLCSAFQLKPYVVGVPIIEFNPKEGGNHQPKVIDSKVVLKEIWTNDAGSPK